MAARTSRASVDGFADARSDSRTGCQQQQDKFDAANEPLQRHNNRSWRASVRPAQRAADAICDECPVRVPCWQGAAAEEYTGIAGGAVWYKGRRVSP